MCVYVSLCTCVHVRARVCVQVGFGLVQEVFLPRLILVSMLTLSGLETENEQIEVIIVTAFLYVRDHSNSTFD